MNQKRKLQDIIPKNIGQHIYKNQIGALEKLFPNKSMKEESEIKKKRWKGRWKDHHHQIRLGGNKMSEYEIGKDIHNLQRELQVLQQLVEQIYTIVDHNLNKGVLKEPEKKK